MSREITNKKKKESNDPVGDTLLVITMIVFVIAVVLFVSFAIYMN